MNKKVNRILRRQIPAVLWAIIIYIASSIPARYLPQPTFFAYDKIVHVTFFFIFGILVYRALEPFDGPGNLNLGRIFVSIAIVIFYGVVDEIHQGDVPGRTLDIYDAFADTVGGLLAGLVIFYRRRRMVRAE